MGDDGRERKLTKAEPRAADSKDTKAYGLDPNGEVALFTPPPPHPLAIKYAAGVLIQGHVPGCHFGVSNFLSHSHMRN